MTILYGITTCDTVRKARKWLDGAGVDYRFHDFRKDGLDAADAKNWIDALGWEAVINRRSTTWRGLDPALREAMNAESALEAILKEPTLVKRPVLVTGVSLEIGFNPARYTEIFA